MSVTLTLTDEQARDWLARVAEAVAIDGSNDAEHDLLIEIADDLRASMGAVRRLRFDAEQLIARSNQDVYEDRADMEDAAVELARAVLEVLP